ncbi:MAG: RelA/SpoT family protein, partial [bacterium]
MALAAAERVLAQERKYEKELQRLIQALKAKEIVIDEPLVWDSFYFATDAHRGQTRFSGEPYISHPVAVLGILVEYTIPDSETLAAALLHDVLEDTPVEPTELLAFFGESIFSLVKGLTKLSRYVHVQDEVLRVQNLRKFFFETVHDLRVLLIKLADRLHNLMTLDFLPDEEKRKRIAQDTFDFYAPLAHRFGFYRLKSLLEDEAFRNTNPGAYESIVRRLTRDREKKDQRIARLKHQLEDTLRRKYPEMKLVIRGRFKHIYSIYQKMTEQGLSFEEIRDLYGLRVVVPTEEDCYRVLGVVHYIWSHIQGYLRDYIGSPKPNGYRSLHTMMIADDGDPIEVQIRSFEMDRLAEYGVAAHWFYKNGTALNQQSKDFVLIREMLSSGDFSQDPRHFLEALKMEVFQQEIFVYTPKGDKVYLPRRATPLDFAYKIHTEVGNRFSKALVNGREVPMDRELRLGDSVEVLTSNDAEPQPYWLNFVKTPSAQFKIKNFLKRRDRALAIEEGRKVLEEEIVRNGLHDMNLLRPS